jgi:exodeoxyribonuclease III
VAIFCKQEPDKITKHLGWTVADTEGRYIQADFGKLSVASLYLPSGTSGEHRQKLKYEFMDHYMKMLEKIAKNEHHEFIICGDWNIAHRNIDLKNWKANQNYTGFLPQERAWLDELFDKVGMIDAFRVLNQEPDQYTWWSSRSPTAREKNVGWRIDYQIVTPNLKNKIVSVDIYTKKIFSDHAPLIMEYDL